MIEIKKGVYKIDGKKITSRDIDNLAKKSRMQDLKIARICLHNDNSSKLMAMAIVVLDKYIYPTHRHNWKDETYTILRGKCLYQEFSENKQLVTEVLMNQGDCILNDSRLFHRIVPCTDVLCFIEHTIGPFTNRPIEKMT